MFYLDELQFLTGVFGSLSGTYISNVSIDSRTIKKDGLYIPIKGENHDGHRFIIKAIENGAVASFWDKNVEIPSEVPYDFDLIIVDSVFDSLYKLADFYRQKVNPTIIGITGSNGKTTTKDIVYSLVSPSFITHKTMGNLNNHYGVPLTLLSMKPNTQVCIVEMGMSGLGEIEKLSRLSRPTYAVITNIGESHLEQLGTRENIAKAKSEIKEGMNNEGLLFFDGDELLLWKTHGIPIGFTRGESRLEIINKDDFSTTFNFRDYNYRLPLIGKHNVKNAAFAIEIAKHLGIDPYDIKNRLEEIKLTGMRMERIPGKNKSTLINDAYNASPLSMKAAIDTVNELKDFKYKVLVLGDMLELGPFERDLHKSVAKHIGPSITQVLLVGERAKWIKEEIHELELNVKVEQVSSPKEAASKLMNLLNEETIILVKASRGMKLDQVIELLKQ